jgi:hypothetical protein
MHAALRYPQQEMMKLLLAAGADVNQKNNEVRFPFLSPLLLCCFPLLHLLMTLSQTFCQGDTALFVLLSLEEGEYEDESVSILLEAGADAVVDVRLVFLCSCVSVLDLVVQPFVLFSGHVGFSFGKIRSSQDLAVAG